MTASFHSNAFSSLPWIQSKAQSFKRGDESIALVEVRSEGFFADFPQGEKVPVLFSERFLEAAPHDENALSLLVTLAEWKNAHLGELAGVAFPFNLFEFDAALSPTASLGSLFDELATQGVRVFCTRMDESWIGSHSFRFIDYERYEVDAEIRRAGDSFQTLITEENSPDFPSERPKWATTLFRRKGEILSIEHWESFKKQKLIPELGELAETAEWKTLLESLTRIFETDASWRNDRLKTALCEAAPKLHDLQSFPEILRAIYESVLPAEVEWVTLNPVPEWNQKTARTHPFLSRDEALRCLEVARDFLTSHERAFDARGAMRS